MDGSEFEVAVAELLEGLGFESVERNRGFDNGADLVATMNGERTAIQAKRWATAVNLEAVRQLLDGIKRYDCTRGLVVTNSFFSEKAVECAGFHGIVLWDRWVLGGLLGGEPPEIDRSVCADCGAPVSKGVTDWCLGHPGRYLGNVFCPKHQKRRNRRVP